MKKYILRPWWLPIFLAFSLGGQNLIIFKTFAYAEDTLTSFQQEVIYAKQKHEAIVSKVTDPGLLMEGQKNESLEKEASSLLDELTKKGD